MMVGLAKSWIQIHKTVFESMNQTYSKSIHFQISRNVLASMLRGENKNKMEKWPSLIKAMRKADDPHALTAQHSSSHLQQRPSALH